MNTSKIYAFVITKLSEKNFKEGLLFISIGVFSALVCSGYAKLFASTEHLSIEFFSSNPELLFIATPAGLIISFLLIRRFAPGASGSGIPQVIACIEPDYHHLASRLLRKSVIIIKIVTSLLSVFVGAAIGREGPSLQVSAAIAHHLGLLFKKFHIKIKPEQVLVAGAASGLASAFNTPIGGIVYAVEELSKEHVRKFKDVLLLSVVISGLTAQLILGNYLYLGYPTVHKDNGLYVLISIAILSVLCGVLGSLFSKLLTYLIQWRSQKKLSSQLIIVGGVGIILALFYYFVGSHSLYSGKEVINYTLFSSDPIEWPFAATRFLGPMLSSMTGIAGGIFAPSLSAGAAIGGMSAELFNPELRNIFALAGMVGFLTGVTHTPITSFILVLEMTDRHSVVLPMMIAAVFSSIGARLISSKSFYEVSAESIMKKEDEDLAKKV